MEEFDVRARKVISPSPGGRELFLFLRIDRKILPHLAVHTSRKGRRPSREYDDAESLRVIPELTDRRLGQYRQ